MYKLITVSCFFHNFKWPSTKVMMIKYVLHFVLQIQGTVAYRVLVG